MKTEETAVDNRQEIYEAISNMLDNPNEHGIYPTTKCYDRLEAWANAKDAQRDELLETIEDMKAAAMAAIALAKDNQS